MLLVKKDLYQKLTFLLILIILFFPTKYFTLYYGLVLIIPLIFLLISNFKLKNSFYLYIFTFLVSLVFFNAALSSIFLNSDFLRNFTEIIRFLPVIIIIGCYNFFVIDYKKICIIFSLYIILATLINVFQFYGLSFANKITEIYNDPAHVEDSLELSNRSLGLSGGPGANGVIFVVLFIFFFVLLISNKYKSVSLIMMFFSVISIFLSQSQTSFVALAIAMLCISFIAFLKNYNNIKFYYVYFLFFGFLGMGLIYLFKNIENFKYLNTLFEQGLNRSSYQNRETKVNDTLALIDENYFFAIIGYGKSFIPNSSALDNEYLFFLAVYGVVGLLCIILLYLYSTVYMYFKGSENIYKYLILCTCLAGMVMAWPSTFLLDPRLLLIFALYIAGYLYESRKLSLNR